jgi:prepilin-type N-terminal cleavage/methylation domain-containing protein
MMKKQHPIATRIASRGFTLMELLVAFAVLALLILLVAQMVNTAATTLRPANKRIDTDTQARVVFDRMAVDFAKMLKRTDIDYYVKGPSGYRNPKAHGKGLKLQSGQQGNDQMTFFSEVPGYYPSTSSQSLLSLVAYRINNNSTSARYLQLERMGKGLLWNGVNNGTNPNSPYPIVFTTGQIITTCTNPCPCNGTAGPWAGPWSGAICDDKSDSDYEAIGPGVFRLENYYLLKDGTISDVPQVKVNGVSQWNFTKSLTANLNAFSDVEAIAVVIAVIDPASRSLVFPNALFNLMSDMADFKNANGQGVGAQKVGDVENNWNLAIQSAARTGATSDGSAFPPAAASAVRIYNRYFDVRTLADL